MTQETERKDDLEAIEQVNRLGEEMKKLALSLAIYLAKAKGKSEELHRMESDFVQLVNGSISVVQEVTAILNAARNLEKMIFEVPSGNMERDRLETRLKVVLSQCSAVLEALPALPRPPNVDRTI
ncbi:MAG: hypothetical protein ACE5FH_04325 [Candidatus Zixiibacteriota bacterium]